MRSVAHPQHKRAVAMPVTSLDGVVHLVSDAVIASVATSATGRYTAMCRASFIPAAMAEPDGARRCPLCGAQTMAGSR